MGLERFIRAIVRIGKEAEAEQELEHKEAKGNRRTRRGFESKLQPNVWGVYLNYHEWFK